jgi:hypothetical protein
LLVEVEVVQVYLLLDLEVVAVVERVVTYHQPLHLLQRLFTRSQLVEEVAAVHLEHKALTHLLVDLD